MCTEKSSVMGEGKERKRLQVGSACESGKTPGGTWKAIEEPCSLPTDRPSTSNIHSLQTDLNFTCFSGCWGSMENIMEKPLALMLLTF
jgi:hypothetical protein